MQMISLPVSPKTLADLNLYLRLLLFVALLAAAYLAKRKRRLALHCTILRSVVSVQILSIIFMMFPSLASQLELQPHGRLFSAELILHHSLGLVVVGLWVYVNLLVAGTVKTRIKLVVFMRTAFTLWVLLVMSGVYQYLMVWS